MLDIYMELNPSLCEPSRPKRRDGVRGALRQFLAEPSTRLWAGFIYTIQL